MTGPELSVVIPTRDRPAALAACLDAVLGQSTERAFEVVVVDDGRHVPVEVPPDGRVTVVQGPRHGPGAARNAGIEAARGEIVLFTDDDTVAHPGWIDAAAEALAARADAVGVEGPTESAFDPLHEHAVSNHLTGALYTCNVGYRRQDLLAEQGFDPRFRFAHCEDRDLGIRMARRGPILFDAAMRMEHPPRPVTMREIVRRGALIESEWSFLHKHPDTHPPRWSVRWGPVVGMARRWQKLIVDDQVVGRSPRRLARAVVLASGQVGLASVVAMTRWRRFARESEPQTGLARQAR